MHIRPPRCKAEASSLLGQMRREKRHMGGGHLEDQAVVLLSRLDGCRCENRANCLHGEAAKRECQSYNVSPLFTPSALAPALTSSKTPLSPFCVSAEHSKYRVAPMSLAICTPDGYEMGCILLSRSLPIVSGSSRRSSLVPTRMMGMLGAWWLISGHHCER